jgi:insecticidal toxin complex protein TccC
MDVSVSMYRAAKISGHLADATQLEFRKEKLKRAQAKQDGNMPARRTAALNMFKRAVSTVIHRNRELQSLGGFVASADVRTLRNRTFFWSGDTQSSSGAVVHSAMATAQHLAERSSGSTVEMTPGGRLLDSYAGHPNSFGYLKERFQYTTSADWRAPQVLREKMIVRGARSTGRDIRQEMGAALYDRLSMREGSGMHGPLARPGSAAGALWDVVSVRFARQAVGRVDVIHAAPSSDPYFRSNTFRNSTWITKERPSLEQQGRTTIRERFAEHLQGHLQAPRHTGLPDWSGTGGFRRNLRMVPRARL